MLPHIWYWCSRKRSTEITWDHISFFKKKKKTIIWNELTNATNRNKNPDYIILSSSLPHFSASRYIAVTQPIKYAKHKNSRRVCLTILLVWAISAAIGSPIVLGLNNTPDRVPDLCVFYNSDFIVYSSLSSFYIPCIIMVFLYWNIFKVSKQKINHFDIVSCKKEIQKSYNTLRWNLFNW